jgi:DNA-binding MarR family transcriptional regulator
MVARFEKFSIAVFELYRCYHKIAAAAMEEYGLKGPHALYITLLYEYVDGLTAAQLTEMCNRDKADVSRALSTLEQKGFVQRQGNGGPKQYRVKLALTDQGKALAQQVKDKAIRCVAEGSKGLSDEDREAFYHALDIITANMQQLMKEGLPAYED